MRATLPRADVEMWGSFANMLGSFVRICCCASIVNAPITHGHHISVWIYRALLQVCSVLLQICRSLLQICRPLLFASLGVHICWCASIVNAPSTHGYYRSVWIYRALSQICSVFLQICQSLLKICRPLLRICWALLFTSVGVRLL